MTSSLRQALAVAALLAGVLLALPWRRVSVWEWLGLAAAVAGAACLLAPRLPVPGMAAAALVLLVLSRLRGGSSRLVLQVTGEAVVVLALYRLAYLGLPAVWLAADAVSRAGGALVGVLTRQPLEVGTTFAALDVLLPALYLAVVLPLRSERPPAGRIWHALLRNVVLVLVCHAAYLVLLSLTPWVLSFDSLKPPVVEDPPAGATPPPPGFRARLHVLLPWNLPLAAAAVQAVVCALLVRSARAASVVGEGPGRRGWRGRFAVWAGAGALLVLQVVLPVVLWRHLPAPDIRDRKVVVYEKGFLNWLTPRHGQYGRLSVGMYGMMPAYLESLGLTPLVSPDLSAKDLEGARAVVLLFPDDPWEPGQLERLWAFARDGGTVLVMGEHTVWNEGPDGKPLPAGPGLEINRFNEVLAPTAMRVKFDSATFAVGGWLHSYEALAHPTTAGIRDEENDFGCVIGASLEVHWPARPLIIGRWGWADPGDPSAGTSKMGNHEYDPGERLGDLVLAAEQPFGKGRIIAFGDTSGLTNGLTVGCHPFTSRLYAYLVGDRPAHAEWTLWLCLLGFAVAVALLLRGPRVWLSAAAVVLLGAATAVSTRQTRRAWDYLPDGRTHPDGRARVPNNLAYIDTSHLGSFSPESWRPTGLGGLSLTLMRDDFLTLNLPEISLPRLERARLLVLCAPAKPFSAAERQAIREFVEGGGVLICTVGYEERHASRELLADLGYAIGLTPEEEAAGMEPAPLGHFKSPFFNAGSYLAYVRFHAAWPVLCTDPKRLVISFLSGGRELIVMRRIGQGLTIVIGDTYFATNRNLEHEGGEPFEGLRENAVFWRWLVALVRDGMGEGERWFPAAADCTPPPAASDESGGAGKGGAAKPRGARPPADPAAMPEPGDPAGGDP